MSPLKSFINRITGNASVRTVSFDYSTCPACLEPVRAQVFSSSCNKCHYTFGRFPIDIAKLSLGWENFAFNGNKHNYDDIVRLYVCTKRTVYPLGEKSECKTIISLSSGETIKITSPYTKDIESALGVLRIRSIGIRFKFYMDQLRTNGYIDYVGDNRLLSNGEALGKKLRINSNGTITHGNKIYDLKAASRKNYLKFGKSQSYFDAWLSYSSDPYRVDISTEGFGFTDEKLSFDMVWDHDVIGHIIVELSKGD